MNSTNSNNDNDDAMDIVTAEDLNDFDYVIENVDFFGDALPSLYDPLDLALEIDNMGSLEEAMPSISQAFGEGEDLTFVQRKKTEAKKELEASPSPKKRGHRRSISDPVNLRHAVFENVNGEPVPASISPRAVNRIKKEAIVASRPYDTDFISGDEVMDTSDIAAMMAPNSTYASSHRKIKSTSSVSEGSVASVETDSAPSSSRGLKTSAAIASKRKMMMDAATARAKNYACSKCGMPKKGHVCPLAPTVPPKMVNMSTQVDLSTTSCERVLVTREFKAVSLA